MAERTDPRITRTDLDDEQSHMRHMPGAASASVWKPFTIQATQRLAITGIWR